MMGADTTTIIDTLNRTQYNQKRCHITLNLSIRVLEEIKSRALRAKRSEIQIIVFLNPKMAIYVC